MKKNLRLVSVAAAALLAVAPVATSVVPTVGANVVKADAGTNSTAAGTNVTISTNTNSSSTSGTTQKAEDDPYFTYNNQQLPTSVSDSTVYIVPNTVSIAKDDTLENIVSKLVSGIAFHSDNTSSVNYNKDNVNQDAFKKELETAGVKFNNKNVVTDVPTSAFNIAISSNGKNNKRVTAQIAVIPSGSSSSTTTDAAAPVFHYTVGNGQSQTGLDGKVFQVAVGSNFNPTNFVDSEGDTVSITAVQNGTNNTVASITSSGSVDTSAAGRYYRVTLTATGLTGKTTSATYTVLVAPNAAQTLHAASGQTTIPTFSIYGNNVVSGSTTFKDGDKVYVGSRARTINGVSYSRVSAKSKSDADSSNTWVLTSALVAPTTPTTPSDTNTQTHTVMIDSRAYDKNGNYLGHMYYAYNDIEIVPTVVTINGKTYYKVANKDEYVRVTNITGNTRTLTHNAYIYWSSYRRTPGTGKMYRGQTVTTYGPAMRFKNGKKYYRIEGCRNNNKRYIKAANLSAAQ